MVALVLVARLVLVAGLVLVGSVASATGPASATGRTTAPPFAFSVSPVTAGSVPYTWRQGCPVGPAQLRMLHLGYWGFCLLYTSRCV